LPVRVPLVMIAPINRTGNAPYGFRHDCGV